MKKSVIFILSLFISTVVVAQNGYRVEIKQVFPKNSTVYSNAFNFKREMDNAISSQTANLNGNSNYKILITTPSGKDTRNIQNINWVQIVNGVKTYHKKETSPEPYYDVATVWEGYSCHMDGSRKGDSETREFVYRVAFADNPNDYKTAFVDKATAYDEANQLFSKKAADEQLVEVVTYSFENGKPDEIDRKSNKEALDQKKAIKVQKDAEDLKKWTNQFITEMAFIHDHKDSLGIEGVKDCRSALEKAAPIPDSVFAAQQLDSLYRSVLLDDVLGSLTWWDRLTMKKETKTYIQNIEKAGSTRDVRNCLLQNTKSLESVLNVGTDKKSKKQ